MNKGGFSWKRATGISAAKSRISRATGVPLSRSGRNAKIGRVVTGGGCLLSVLTAFVAAALLLGCTPVETAPTPAPAAEPTPAPATMAETALAEIKPVVGEQVAFLGDETDETVYLMDRLMAASDAHPEWEMSGEKVGVDGDQRAMPYRFKDGSLLTILATPRPGVNQGLQLKEVIVQP